MNLHSALHYLSNRRAGQTWPKVANSAWLESCFRKYSEPRLYFSDVAHTVVQKPKDPRNSDKYPETLTAWASAMLGLSLCLFGKRHSP